MEKQSLFHFKQEFEFKNQNIMNLIVDTILDWIVLDSKDSSSKLSHSITKLV